MKRKLLNCKRILGVTWPENRCEKKNLNRTIRTSQSRVQELHSEIKMVAPGPQSPNPWQNSQIIQTLQRKLQRRSWDPSTTNVRPHLRVKLQALNLSRGSRTNSTTALSTRVSGRRRVSVTARACRSGRTAPSTKATGATIWQTDAAA